MFESRLVAALAALVPGRPVLVEAESSKVGDLVVPPAVWAAMCAAPRLQLVAAPADRARYLARAYGDIAADRDGLKAILDQLVVQQGRARVAHWQGLVDAGAFEALALELITVHYDGRYARARSGHAAPVRQLALTLDRAGLERVADRLLAEIATVAG